MRPCRGKLDPRWTPSDRPLVLPQRETAATGRFRKVGAVGFEPTTFRPPAERLTAATARESFTTRTMTSLPGVTAKHSIRLPTEEPLDASDGPT